MPRLHAETQQRKSQEAKSVSSWMLDRISVRIPQHEVGVSEYRGPTIVP